MTLYFKERFNMNFLKHLLKVVSFLLIVLIILYAISPIFTPKTNSDLKGKTANGFLAEPHNSIDMVLIGDSECYSSFIPLQMFNEYGISSYNCGTPRQTLTYTEDLLSSFFETQNPKIVVIETNAFFREVTFRAELTSMADKHFSIYRYHDRWKKLSLADFSNKVDYTYVENDKGYRWSVTIKSADVSGYMKPSNEKAIIPEKNIKYIKKIVELCKSNGAEPLFVSTPSTKNWNSKRHNAVDALANELGVKYMDLNTVGNELSIDWSVDTKDKGDHLNYSGAKKVTSFIGKYFSSQFSLADHRNDNTYQDWNKAYDNFLRDISRADKT